MNRAVARGITAAKLKAAAAAHGGFDVELRVDDEQPGPPWIEVRPVGGVAIRMTGGEGELWLGGFEAGRRAGELNAFTRMICGLPDELLVGVVDSLEVQLLDGDVTLTQFEIAVGEADRRGLSV